MADKQPGVIALDLYLVRHGNSLSNAGLAGDDPMERYDSRLSPLGEQQIELLGPRFAQLPFDHILSSGLRRTLATADAVVRSQPADGAHTIEVHPVFTEWGIPPACPGRTMDEIRADFPRAAAAPGAEQYARMIDHTLPGDQHLAPGGREIRAVEYLRQRFTHGERVLLSGHGCFNGFMLYHILGIPESAGFTLDLYNTGVTRVIFYQPGTGPVRDTELVFFNDCSHLFPADPVFCYR